MLDLFEVLLVCIVVFVCACALGCLEIVVNILFFVFRGFTVPAFLCLVLSFYGNLEI